MNLGSIQETDPLTNIVGEQSLLTLWTSYLVKQLTQWITLPYVNPKHEILGDLMRGRMQRDSCMYVWQWLFCNITHIHCRQSTTVDIDGWDNIVGITTRANTTCKLALTGATMVSPSVVCAKCSVTQHWIVSEYDSGIVWPWYSVMGWDWSRWCHIEC